MIDQGWLKLHRSTLEWQWYDDIPAKVLFIHLMLKANYKASKYHGVDVPVGAVVTGRKLLSAETGLTEQQIRTALVKLKSTSTITIKTHSKFSVISIVNWNLYQQDNQQTNHVSTSNQPAINQQSTTSKERKKERKEEYNPAVAENDLFVGGQETAEPENTFDDWYKHYTLKKGRGQAEKAFKAAMKIATFDQLVEGAKAYSRQFEGKNKTYMQHPATWLRAQGWLNEDIQTESDNPNVKFINGKKHMKVGYEWLPLN